MGAVAIADAFRADFRFERCQTDVNPSSLAANYYQSNDNSPLYTPWPFGTVPDNDNDGDRYEYIRRSDQTDPSIPETVPDEAEMLNRCIELFPASSYESFEADQTERSFSHSSSIPKTVYGEEEPADIKSSPPRSLYTPSIPETPEAAVDIPEVQSAAQALSPSVPQIAIAQGATASSNTNDECQPLDLSRAASRKRINDKIPSTPVRTRIRPAMRDRATSTTSLERMLCDPPIANKPRRPPVMAEQRITKFFKSTKTIRTPPAIVPPTTMSSKSSDASKRVSSQGHFSFDHAQFEQYTKSTDSGNSYAFLKRDWNYRNLECGEESPDEDDEEKTPSPVDNDPLPVDTQNQIQRARQAMLSLDVGLSLPVIDNDDLPAVTARSVSDIFVDEASDTEPERVPPPESPASTVTYPFPDTSAPISIADTISYPYNDVPQRQSNVNLQRPRVSPPAPANRRSRPTSRGYIEKVRPNPVFKWAKTSNNYAIDSKRYKLTDIHVDNQQFSTRRTHIVTTTTTTVTAKATVTLDLSRAKSRVGLSKKRRAAT